MTVAAHPGSFRDPSGQVYEIDGQIFRTVTETAREDYEFVRDSGLLARFSDRGWLIGTEEVHPHPPELDRDSVRYVLRHPRISFVSYPYEWPFGVLKTAALLQLDLHLALLDEGACLSDASAYNLQFQGPRPVFIDVLSIRRYRDGEYWTGHRQFCEQFLNPLLLRSAAGVAFNAWFRGALEGIPTKDLARVLPLRRRMSWNVLTHVLLQARLEQRAIEDPGASVERIRHQRFTRASYLGILRQLRAWIARMEPAATGKTVWEDYQESHRYGSEDERSKRDFVSRFVRATKPRLLWDLGCNVGNYSTVALEAGAEEVIGFDSDFNALEAAFHRAKSRGLAFLPLFMDAANPSPDQGWRQQERPGFSQRARADAVLALAFAHHLAIGRNAPMAQVISWLISVAPRGVIEFVPKSDPTIGQMLALREDVFENYSQEIFMASIEREAHVVETRHLEQTGRLLCWYDKRS